MNLSKQALLTAVQAIPEKAFELTDSITVQITAESVNITYDPPIQDLRSEVK